MACPKIKSTVAAFLLAGLLAPFATLPAVGQHAHEEASAPHYTVDFRGMPLAQALQQLAVTTGVGLVYDPALVSNLKTTCSARNQPVEAILRCLLEDSGLAMERLPAVAYVIRQRETPGASSAVPEQATPQAVRYGSIRGTLLEEESDAPLVGAHVVVAGHTLGAAAGPGGRFEIARVPVGVHTLEASMIGFETKQLARIRVRENTVTEIAIVLGEAPTPLGEVIVTPGYFSLMHRQPVALQTLTRTEIRDMPHIADDAYRAITRLPGVSGNDQFAGFTVRGGSHEEVLVQLDGMELDEPFHLKSGFGGGLMSIIDTEAVGGMDMMTGAFPVEYGDRLSGVFNIDSSTPSAEQARTSVGLSFTNTRLLSEGRFGNGKGQWLVIGRRGYVDLLLKLAKADDMLSYYDVFGKVRYQLHPKHALALHVLHAKDNMRFLDKETNDRGNWVDGTAYGWATWTATLHRRLLAQTVLSASTIDRTRDATFITDGTDLLWSTVDDRRNVDFFGLKQDWTLELADNVLLKWGGEMKQFDAEYDYYLQVRTSREMIGPDEYLLDFDTTRTILNPSGRQLAAYLGGRVRPMRALTAEIGLRYDETGWTDDRHWSPRVNLAYALGKRTTLRLGWGRFSQAQGIHQLTIEDGDATFFPSETARHRVAGLEHVFRSGLHVRFEAYHKKLSDLRPRYVNLLDGAIHNQRFPEVEEDRIRLEPSHGTAKGLELFVKKNDGGRFGWWATYSLALAEDRIANAVLTPHFEGSLSAQDLVGTDVPRAFDQRHTFYGDVSYRLNPRWGFNLAFQLHSGWPYTLTTRRTDLRTFEFGPLNGERGAVYHRLDARMSRHFAFSRSRMTVFLEFMNLLNRNNLRRATEVRTGPNGETLVDRDEETWTTLVPSFGIRWDFNH